MSLSKEYDGYYTTGGLHFVGGGSDIWVNDWIELISKKLNVTPLKKTTIKFLNWFAEYNIIPKGMALKISSNM